jgi:luciferase family oxidoreductase group 1
MVPRLAPVLEGLGYARYWLTEHHSPQQSGSPTVLAAVAASRTRRLRVGTAGVLLRLWSPARVVEDFRLLELLYPGRLDLGLAGALPQGPLGRALLDGRCGEASAYPERVAEVVRLIRHLPASEGGLEGREVGPLGPGQPQLWLCGTSRRSAELAGRLGMAYAFHDFLARGKGEASGPEALDAYRQAFRPAPDRPRPLASVALLGLCCGERRRALRGWPLPEQRPCFLGTPPECREQILLLREAYGADEVALESFTPSPRMQLESYRLLAEALGLSGESVRAQGSPGQARRRKQ